MLVWPVGGDRKPKTRIFLMEFSPDTRTLNRNLWGLKLRVEEPTSKFRLNLSFQCVSVTVEPLQVRWSSRNFTTIFFISQCRWIKPYKTLVAPKILAITFPPDTANISKQTASKTESFLLHFVNGCKLYFSGSHSTGWDTNFIQFKKNPPKPL